MNIGTAPDADLRFVPGRAAIVAASRTLLVADLHLGKAATFRRAGIPVPEGSAQGDLARLERLVAEHDVQRVLVLGDLFHARSGCTERVAEEFRGCRRRLAQAEFLLVLGNHDRGLRMSPAALVAHLGIDACVAALDEPPFRFVHEPASDATAASHERIVVAGHLHPRLAIVGPGRTRIAERCFVAEPGAVVLPAFGSFTGGHLVGTAPGRRLWFARDDAVVDVTRMATLAAARR